MNTHIVQWLRQRKSQRFEKMAPDPAVFDRVRVLPPFESQVAILRAQCGKWKLLAFAGFSLAALSTISSAVVLHHRLFQKMNSEYIVVPGAAEFMRVRPNLIPDSVVKDFAQFVATYAGNFTYRNAKEHFETVAERMVPSLKGRFLRDAEARFAEWARRRVDQVFAFEPIDIHVARDGFGAKYVLVARGKRSLYADGTMLQETDENLYLELRPRLTLMPGRRHDESLLVIERLDWVTSSQAEALLSPHITAESNAERLLQK